jgi:hypothetical protein
MFGDAAALGNAHAPFLKSSSVSKGVRPGTVITQNFGTANSAG